MLESFSLLEDLKYRLATQEDDVFLEQLFRYTRDDLYQLPMSREFIDKLVVQQYQLQQASYRQQAPDAKVYVVESRQTAIGKIMLHFDISSIHIVDFSILPAERGQGIGTRVLQAVQNVARQQKCTIRLSVDRMNMPAKKLYLSQGFVIAGAGETHETMVWNVA
ncbi:GNAT family N-acetyltransferase [Cellvibrio sp. ARAG 10.3]|uniref:GNAT family N-acetyltransferase n=1 Tax=Cellvibrio sp. ARAG 10.3 TaxID=3451358 RepID=UPI003F47025F